MGLNNLKSHRISTTISQKHWAILEKYAEKYATQQKVLEKALESLDKSPGQTPPLTREMEVWMMIGKEMKDSLVLFQKDYAKMLLNMMPVDEHQKYVNDHKPVEYAIEFYYKKPLKSCSLQEIIDGEILNLRIQGSVDFVSYEEHADHYMMNIMHSLGLNASKQLLIMNESPFKNYGARYEAHYSEHHIFLKIYKN